MINQVVFYQHWHYGDCFVGKEYVKMLIEHLNMFGDIKVYYTHPCGPKVLADLPLEYIPWNVGQNMVPHMNDKVTLKENVLFVNTWVGAYISFFKPEQVHGNFPSLNTAWKCIFYIIENMFRTRILSSEVIGEYKRLPTVDMLPTTDWSFFDISPAQEFVKDKKDIVLFCNSRTASCQTRNSGIEFMVDMINNIAQKNPSTTFVCTQRIPTNNFSSNIFFTDDIFANVKGGDINEIAFLSIFCKMIIGKSSGPYTFCHVRDNIMRDNCIFYCITDRQSDCLLYDFFDSKSRNYQFVGRDERAAEFSIDAILNNKMENISQFAIIGDGNFLNLQKTMDYRNH